MMEILFPVYVKSTLEKLCQDLANQLGCQRLDLDDIAGMENLAMGKDAAILHELIGVDPSPRWPLYSISLSIGARTSDDPGSYKLIEFYSKVQSLFSPGATIQIYDYSVPEGQPTPHVGYMVVSRDSSGSGQQASERSGIRLTTIRLQAVAL